MRSTRWIALLCAALLWLPACERKAEKDDDNGASGQAAEADEQAQETAAAQQGEQADETGEADGDAEADGDEEVGVPPLDELDPAVRDPSQATEQAPETFRAEFVTTEGDFVIEFNRDWAPNGVDRAYNLIKSGYYDGVAFFRVVEGFMAQFGIHGHPEVNEAWMEATAEPDPLVESNERGMVTFAQRSNPETRESDPATRTTHLFVNYTDNSSLDEQQFVPVGEVVEGMDVVDSLYSGYGGGPPNGPNQKEAMEEGEDYLKENFPELDYIKEAKVVESNEE